MALYDFRCASCGERRDSVFLRVAELDTEAAPHCCGALMGRFYGPDSVPMAHVDVEYRYVCPKTGELITSRRQRANNFARHGLMDANDFTPDFVKREQDEKWGRIRKLAAAHDETNRRIVGGDMSVSQLVPAE